MNHQQKSDSMHQFHPICIRQACKATKSNVTEFSVSSRQKESSWFAQGSTSVLAEQKELYITAGRFSNHKAPRLLPVYLPHRRKWERRAERMKQIERHRARERDKFRIVEMSLVGLWDRLGDIIIGFVKKKKKNHTNGISSIENNEYFFHFKYTVKNWSLWHIYKTK